MSRTPRWFVAGCFYWAAQAVTWVADKVATPLYDVGSWLMRPYGEHHMPDGDTFVAQTMARQDAESRGEGMARRQLAAGIMAADMATGERVAERTNGHGPKVDD